MTPVALHSVVEALAYFVGFRLFLHERRRLALPVLADTDRSVWIAVGAIVGAALGAKLGFWIEDPQAAFADFPDWRRLLEGKTIVGALLGGLAGVEIAKHAVGAQGSSGDAFALPLIVGIAIGRIGCFLAGLADHTYGNPSGLPWAVDFGDGVPRHPTQLYDIAVVAALALALHAARDRLARVPGLAFKLFLAGYLAWRVVIDHWKPVHFAWPGGLSGLQVLALAFLAVYLPLVVRAARRLR